MVVNTVEQRLNNLSTLDLQGLFNEGGLPNFTEFSIENVGVVIENELKAHKEDRVHSNIANAAIVITEQQEVKINWRSLEALTSAVEQFLEKYLSEVKWTLSQLNVTGGESQATFHTANLIYQSIPNKKVLARPEVLPQTISMLYISKQLKGYKGMLIYNLSGRIPGRESWSEEQHLQQEIKVNNFFNTKPEGKALFGRKVMSKEQYLEYSYTYSNPHARFKHVPKDEDSINYVAYLAQMFPFRNTKILADKTKVFMSLLKGHDEDKFNEVISDPTFSRTRIYEKDGYVLVLRSRFVLIDSIRNQVIINKTPTNMAKKDIELIVRLIASN